MEKKKILILALFGDPTLPAGVTQTGGFNQTLKELLISLSAFSIPICVVTDTSQYISDPYQKISSNIDLYRIFISKSEHENQQELRITQRRILNDIINILGKTLDDIALIHSFYWFSGHLAKCLNRIYQIPYIHTPVSLAYNKKVAGHKANCPFQEECEPSFLQNASLVLAITQQEANILTSYYQVRNGQIIITGRSVDKVFHSPTRDAWGYPRGFEKHQHTTYKEQSAPWWNAGAFTYLGRMVPIKGILEIVQSWISLRERCGSETPPLWLVGGSPVQIANIREELATRVGNLSKYETQHEIVWWGYLDQPSISALFLKTLVLVTHSRFEAGGRVILEAMCQGKPVIATPNGFAADLIQDGFNGFLVPYGDVKHLERCMEYFVRQPYLSSSMGNVAKSTFKQIEHSWKYTVIHQQIYEKYLFDKVGDIKNSVTSSQLFTYETPDKVDCFPYLDLTFSETEWINELSTELAAPVNSFEAISLPDARARHYRCIIDGMSYRVKQFYNRVNRDAIWNRYEKNKVLGSMERMCLAMTSQNFSCIAPIFSTSVQGNYYILPDLETIQPTYEILCALLNDFCASNLPKDLEPAYDQTENSTDTMSCPKTLETLFTLLEISSKELGQGISHKNLQYLPQIESLLKYSQVNARYGLNYGKSLIQHVVIQNERPMLLPTADWYWGEVGIDFVIAAIETGTDVHAIQEQSDDTRQLLWLVCLAWKEILQAEWKHLCPETFWTQMLSTTLSALGIAT